MQESFESLRKEKYETKLSKHVWNLEKENRQFSIRRGHRQANTSRQKWKTKLRSVQKKAMIMKGRSRNVLNRRSQMFSKCGQF